MKIKATHAQKLGQELFEVGLKMRRDIEGFSDKSGWHRLSDIQRVAWFSIGKYVLKNFKQRTTKP